MRRSGSSSCLLRPRSSLSLAELAEFDSRSRTGSVPGITIVNTKRLASYGTERYYMLSEIETNARSVQFLCDFPSSAAVAASSPPSPSSPPPPPLSEGGESTAEGGGSRSVDPRGRAASGRSSSAWPPEKEPEEDDARSKKKPLPPYVMLYLLWRPGTYPSPRSFAEGPVEDAVKHVLALNGEGKRFEEAASKAEEEARRVSLSGSTLSAGIGTPPASPLTPRSPYRKKTATWGKSSSMPLPPPLPFADEGGVGTPPSSPKPDLSFRPPPPRRVEANENDTRIHVFVDRVAPPPPSFSRRVDGLGDGVGPASDDAFDRASRPPALAEEEEPLPPPPPPSFDKEDDSDDDRPERIERLHKSETRTAESLARVVAQSKLLRNLVDGITIGTTHDPRSAPALEACLSTAGLGAKERRRRTRGLRNRNRGRNRRGSTEGEDVDPSKSAVGLVASHPDDLVGIDPHADADGAQGVVQSRTAAEWNGNGDHRTFAVRAQRRWRSERGIDDPTGGKNDEDEFFAEEGPGDSSPVGTSGRRKTSRRKRRETSKRASSDEMEGAEEFATFMVMSFMIFVLSYLWRQYGDDIEEFVLDVLKE